MRLLNLDIDDFYLLAKPDKVVNGSREVDGLSINLGKRINNVIPNKVYFGGNRGWDVSSTERFQRSSFSLKRGKGSPVIWEEGIRTSAESNLLFTGVYTKDVANLVTTLYLLVDDLPQVEQVEVIAGGNMSIVDGGEILNLLLKVPKDIHYVIDGVGYSCNTGYRVFKKTGYPITLSAKNLNISI